LTENRCEHGRPTQIAMVRTTCSAGIIFLDTTPCLCAPRHQPLSLMPSLAIPGLVPRRTNRSTGPRRHRPGPEVGSNSSHHGGRTRTTERHGGKEKALRAKRIITSPWPSVVKNFKSQLPSAAQSNATPIMSWYEAHQRLASRPAPRTSVPGSIGVRRSTASMKKTCVVPFAASVRASHSAPVLASVPPMPLPLLLCGQAQPGHLRTPDRAPDGSLNDRRLAAIFQPQARRERRRLSRNVAIRTVGRGSRIPRLSR
jgi:hypothetical protein